jgi:hypothetical protein
LHSSLASSPPCPASSSLLLVFPGSASILNKYTKFHLGEYFWGIQTKTVALGSAGLEVYVSVASTRKHSHDYIKLGTGAACWPL